MRYAAHDYQEYATEMLIQLPACGLFLDIGMGKTAITLTAVQELLHDYFEVRKVLVIAPLRVADHTWSQECRKWDHLNYLKISKVLGSKSQRIQALNTRADIYVINRENTEWLVKHCGQHWPFDLVIIDELSSFKSAAAKRFKALRRVRPQIKRVVGLTATPAPNGLIDLWPQLYLLDGGQRLGYTLTDYRDHYFEPDKRSGQVIYSYRPRFGAEQRIFERISDICISLKALDFLELPERIDNYVEVRMSDAEQTLYRQLERDTILPFAEGDIDAVNAAALSNKLLQMANGAVYDDNGAVRHIHDRKLEALEDLLESANGKPLLVFYAYRHDKGRLQRFFQARGIDPQVLNSSQDIDDWNTGNIEVAILHPASAGHGLNLQAGGNIIIWFGLTWSLELYQQANGRLYRQGQEQAVIIHHIITAGTIDEEVVAALQRKDTGQQALINAVNGKIQEVIQ